MAILPTQWCDTLWQYTLTITHWLIHTCTWLIRYAHMACVRTHILLCQCACTDSVSETWWTSHTHTHTHFSEPGQRWQVIKPKLFYIGIVSSNTFHLGGRMSSSPCFWHLASSFNMTLLVHAAGLFWCYHSPSNSDMDFRIFNVHM